MTTSRTPIPSGLSPEDAAAAWLARHDADPSTAADPTFLAWLGESQENRTVWARAQAVWRRATQDLNDDPLAEALRANALAARPSPWPKALAAASIAVAVLLGGVGGWRYWADHMSPAPISSPQSAPVLQLATRMGERRAVTLEDGTRLDLDSDTRVDVAFNDKARRLTLLKGRTYVQVAHDTTRPFAVDVGDQTIVDRGTAFAVRFESGTIAVMLAQGSVAVGERGSAPDHALKPGQRLVLQTGQVARVEPFDLATAFAWRDGFVEFSDTPLADAVAEMNHHNSLKMVIVDPSVRSLKVSGRFKLGEPERFLRTVSLLLPVRAVRVGETIEIRAAPSEPTR